MISAFATSDSFDFKVCFDGLDLLKSNLGKELVNDSLRHEILDHFTAINMDDHQDLLEIIVSECMSQRRRQEPYHLVPVALRDRYEIGVFTTGQNVLADVPYALFDDSWLGLWESGNSKSTRGVKFLVAPSRGIDGRITDIGFRVLNTSEVHDAFKWTFMLGQQATYGLDRVNADQPLVLVEGAWDQLALEQSGVPNVVGLGAVGLTAGHSRILSGLDYAVCWDQDTFGIAQRGSDKCVFFEPEGKDPFDAWITHGRVGLVHTSK